MASETAALVGERLRTAREERGWTRRRLVSEMDGIAVENDVYRWEAGKHRPRDDALAAAARALGKPLSYFLGDEPRITPDLSSGSEPTQLDNIEKMLNELLRRTPAAQTAPPPADLENLENLLETVIRLLKESQAQQGSAPTAPGAGRRRSSRSAAA